MKIDVNILDEETFECTECDVPTGRLMIVSGWTRHGELVQWGVCPTCYLADAPVAGEA